MAISWMDAEKHQPPAESLLLVVEFTDGVGRVGDIVAGFYTEGEYSVGTTHAGDPLPDNQVVRYWALPNWPDGYDDAGCWKGPAIPDRSSG